MRDWVSLKSIDNHSLLLRLIIFLLFFLWFFSSLMFYFSFYYSLLRKLLVPLFFDVFFSTPRKLRGFTKFDRLLKSWLCFVSRVSRGNSGFIPMSFLVFLNGQLNSLFFADRTSIILISSSWAGNVSSETTFVCYRFWLTADSLQVDSSKIEVKEKLRNWLWLIALSLSTNWADLSWLIVKLSSSTVRMSPSIFLVMIIGCFEFIYD